MPLIFQNITLSSLDTGTKMNLASETKNMKTILFGKNQERLCARGQVERLVICLNVVLLYR